MATSQFNALINKWETHQFSSGSYKGQDFISFAKEFKASLKKMVNEIGFTIVPFKPGHYYISGFLVSPEGKYVYFSLSDVRHGLRWREHLLVRSATSAKDYSGGANSFTTLEKMDELILSITSR